MKRYWKILFLCILSIVVIGTFYIQSSLAGKDPMHIELEKVKGNEKEVKDLIIYGDYEIGNLYQGFQITNEETFYPSNQTLWQQLSTDRYSPIFKELIKNHKSFMRGKELASTSFYEDEKRLAYAGFKGDMHKYPADEIKFNIQILNKKTDETFTIESVVPERDKYSWLNVEDVQVFDDTIKVLTRGFGSNSGEDLLVYTFDLNEKKLIANDTIFSTQTSGNKWTEIGISSDYSSIQAQSYYIVNKRTYEAQDVQGNGQAISYNGDANLVADEVFIYDLETSKLKKLKVPDELLESFGYSTVFDSTLFVHKPSDNGIEVYPYDIEKAEWGDPLTINIPPLDNSSKQIKLMNGKIYVIHSTNNEHTLLIDDLKTGETLYEGKIVTSNEAKDGKEFRLNFHDMELLSKK